MRLLFIAALVLSAGCATARPDGVRVSADGVRFETQQPGATSVAVAGDFNDWSRTTHPMVPSGRGWTCVVRLPPGEYAFMYVVDGASWVTPRSAAEVAPDGFGGWNGKIVVP